VTTVVALLVAGFTSILYYDETVKVESLEYRLRANDYEIQGLEAEIDTLQGQITDQQEQLETLESQLNQLIQEYNSLYTSAEFMYNMSVGNGLTSYYDTLREWEGPTGGERMDYRIWFATYLAMHDAHRLYMLSAEIEYNQSLGEKSYAQAYDIVTNALRYSGVDADDTKTELIEKVLGFVSSYVQYEHELDDSVRAPVETLSLRSGDCDDYSILVSCMLEIVDVWTAICFLEDGTSGHAMVLVHLDELEGYPYVYYDDLTDLGLCEGRWILIEPQTTIDQQYGEHMTKWNLYLAREPDIGRKYQTCETARSQERHVLFSSALT
jgi:uncharacterized coiled-coil protein SlyX